MGATHVDARSGRWSLRFSPICPTALTWRQAISISFLTSRGISGELISPQMIKWSKLWRRGSNKELDISLCAFLISRSSYILYTYFWPTLYVCVCVYIYVCVCVCVYIYIFIQIQIRRTKSITLFRVTGIKTNQRAQIFSKLRNQCFNHNYCYLI